jgi:Tol biopolymer transport system component
MNADGSDRRLLTIGGWAPTWSPDGTNIAYNSGDNILIVPLHGGTATSSGPATKGDSPDWSPDGRQIAFSRNHGIYVLTLSTGEVSRLPTPRAIRNLFEPVWSPDGTRIAFTTTTNSEGTIGIVNSDGKGYVGLIDGYSPTWSPDGTKLAFQRGREGQSVHIFSENVGGTDLRQLTFGDVVDRSPDWSSVRPPG